MRAKISKESASKNLRTIDDFSTIIDDGFKPLYWLEIWQSGTKTDDFPILLPEIVIGRDYDECKAHVRLKSENQKISSFHTSVQINEKKEVKLTSLNKNYTQIGNVRIALRTGFPSEVRLEINGAFQIYEFEFRLRRNGSA